jgi:hypothetical protein
MKKVFFAIALLTVFACSEDGVSTSDYSSKVDSPVTQTFVEPVNNLNGVYYARKSARYVNLGFYTNYDAPTFQEHYFTIKRNGVIVANYYTSTTISIPVSSGFVSGTFSVSQTLVGVGTSAEVSVVVSK